MDGDSYSFRKRGLSVWLPSLFLEWESPVEYRSSNKTTK